MRALMLLLPALMLLTGCATIQEYTHRGTVPLAADIITDQIDEQILARYMPSENMQRDMTADEVDMARKCIRSKITIMGTVPANVNNLEVTCPLARQMMEEVSRGLMARGYKFQELRKGRNIYFQPQEGEFVLTRKTGRLERRTVESEGILAGTYVTTPVQVRFSMRILSTLNSEVLAIGTGTVPISDDVRPLLVNTSAAPSKVVPSIKTNLR